MFWFAEAAQETAEHAEEATHHSPIIVQLVNHWFGEPVYEFQMTLHQTALGQVPG